MSQYRRRLMMNPLSGKAEPGEVVLTSSTSWTVPVGVTSICVLCVGGGGGAH